MVETVDCNELVLKKVKISGDVVGKFGTFEIEQTFINNTKNVIEAGYTFPIAETATVTGFEISIGDKILKGKVKEKQKAKKEYQNNIVKGNSAYLLEEKSENVFALTVGKLDKNEEAKVKIKFIDKFDITDNQIKIFIPTLVPPKYNDKTTEKLSYGKVDYTVDFDINIQNSIGIDNILSPSHKLNIFDKDDKTVVKVLNYDMSKDFRLDITLKEEQLSNALSYKTKDNEEILYLSFMPEIDDVFEDNEKEYIFLVDTSGSMHGRKLSETKRAVVECLKQLDEGDKFNIIAFESDFVPMMEYPVRFNEDNLENAISFVNTLEAYGGTEILKPVKFVLDCAESENERQKIVLLFTDGEVGEEWEIIDYVEENIKNGRLFPFGIDLNVNSFFINEIAKVGQGKAEFIMPNEKIDDKIIRTFARIQTPLVENITIDYGKNVVLDEIRNKYALFNYEFYDAFVKIKELVDDIKLTGTVENGEYSWKISKDKIKATNINLEILFAKEEINRLEDYMRECYDDEKEENYKKLIVEIAEKYNINSKYTSFLTVYERENKILELPKYQETTLSSEEFDCEDICYCLDIPEFLNPDRLGFSASDTDSDKKDNTENSSIKIDDLELSTRTYNCLKKTEKNPASKPLEESEQDLSNIKNSEENSSDEIKELAESIVEVYSKDLKYTEDPEQVKKLLSEYSKNPTDDLLSEIEFEFPSLTIKKAAINTEIKKLELKIEKYYVKLLACVLNIISKYNISNVWFNICLADNNEILYKDNIENKEVSEELELAVKNTSIPYKYACDIGEINVNIKNEIKIDTQKKLLNNFKKHSSVIQLLLNSNIENIRNYLGERVFEEFIKVQAEEYGKYLNYTESPEETRNILLQYVKAPQDELLSDIEFEFPSEAIKLANIRMTDFLMFEHNEIF